MVPRLKCLYCGEELRFERGRGYVHQDGSLYKQRQDPRTGDMVDDHVATPDRSQAGWRRKR